MASKLQDLINRLCPNGVEYRRLGEIATIERGNGLQKSDFTPSGIPCIHYGQLYTKLDTAADSALTFVDEKTASNLKSLNHGDLLMAVTSENVEDVCKCIAWLGNDGVVVGGHTAIIRHDQNAKFLSYWFQTQDFFAQKKKLAHGTKVIEVTPQRLTDILIPLPPLEVQGEIVQILDNFAELTAELTAELEKRKKQYEYYRRALLCGGESSGWPMVKLGDVSGISVGSKPTNATGFGTYDYVNAGISPSGRCDSYNTEAETVTTPSRGQGGIGYVGYQENPFWCGPLCYRIRSVNSKVTTKYLYYYLSTHSDSLLAMKKTGGVPALNLSDLKLLPIPLPPLAEQRRIVSILDRFDRLCNDLTSGLPAEIAARKKQYAYYRDRLLDFKPAPKGCGAASNRKGAA